MDFTSTTASQFLLFSIYLLEISSCYDLSWKLEMPAKKDKVLTSKGFILYWTRKRKNDSTKYKGIYVQKMCFLTRHSLFPMISIVSQCGIFFSSLMHAQNSSMDSGDYSMWETSAQEVCVLFRQSTSCFQFWVLRICPRGFHQAD